MLTTKFSNELNPDKVLPEYPRPNLRRDSYYNMNGYWDYAFTKTDKMPSTFDGKILVPFSPESKLSGVERRLEPEEYLWYRLNFDNPFPNKNRRILLHFGAVDQTADVYINQHFITTHLGGYLPFTADITDYMNSFNNTLIVKVKDVTDTSYHSRGKQKLKCSGMFYTAQSGIWQTVWMEYVPESYITDLKITPNYDNQTVTFSISLNKDDNNAPVDVINDSYSNLTGDNEILIYDGTNVVAQGVFTKNLTANLTLKTMRSWTPETPFLYDVTIKYGTDNISSYFAMRKFSTGLDCNGIMRLQLNNRPYFHNGLLDQGYWPESLYTPPSEKAMLFDIKTAKSLGFNLLRKHAKIEPLRWYYACDRLGMLVWQDMVNGGSSYHTWFVTYFPTICTHIAKRMKDNHYQFLSRSEEKGRDEFIRETKETIQLLYNFACIAMWVPFNEAWGQFDSKEITTMIKKIDSTRTIDSASGWFDQKCGDVRSLHIYFTRLKFRKENRAVVLSEFGGYVLRVPKHYYSNKTYGYRIYKTKKKFTKALDKLYYKKIIPGIEDGLSAAVYTQLTDIEEEINGLITYDRKVLKLNKEKIKKINQNLFRKFKKITQTSK